MTETFALNAEQPGAVVHVDPHLEAVLVLNLLDETPEPAWSDLEPPRFKHAISRGEERIPVLSR